MSTPRMTEQELQEAHRRVRLSRAAKGRVRGGVDRTRAVVGVQASEKPGAAPDSPPSRVWVKPESSPAPSPSFAPFRLVLKGQLPSGKNQVQLLWRNGKVHKYPNKTFTKWRDASMAQITPEFFQAPNITIPVSLTCHYWPGDLRTRDVSGQLDALFHLLVYAKVLKDDGLIWSVWWRRHEMTRSFPQVVLEIEGWQP